MDINNKNKVELKFGYYSSLFLTILTIVAFGFAMLAIPPSGPYCQGNCMEYPFSDILDYYPRDYNWMYFVVFQLFSFLIFIISCHFVAAQEKKIYSSLSKVFAVISATVLLIAYFTQFAIVPISMMKGEIEGIAILTQYNGHGIFIVLEELGYTMMSISFLFLAFIFTMKNKLEKALRILLVIPFVVTVLSFIFYTIQYGLDRDYRFEVATITINWLITIVIGVLSSIYFKRLLRLT